MWDSIYKLPNDFSNFWDAHFINKAQILFLLFLLYLFGYYSSKLLVNRNILKWGIFIFFFLPFLISIFHSKQIIFILPVALGILKGLFIGNASFNPFGAFEGLMDFFLSVKYRRGKVELQQKYEEAEEILRKAKAYENQARSSAHEQATSKEQFREEMKREREWQEREAKKKAQSSNSNNNHNGSQAHSEKTTSNGNKKHELNPEVLSDAYEILGVRFGASLAECKKARMTLLTLYHPDKVAHLNETRKTLAEAEAKRINASWEKVKGNL